MKICRFEKSQLINSDIDTVWNFFSNPSNLSKITPKEMNFEILSPSTNETYQGQIITYFVKPIFGIKMRWVTEITSFEKNKMFVDEQRFGPYKFWHHEHFFEVKENGILMKDIIHYALPFNLLIDFIRIIFRINFAKIIVEKKLKHIFAFRENQIIRIFHE